MPKTYSKETALYDTDAISEDIADASEVATRYVTEMSSSGVKVHPSGSTSDYVQIDANGTEVVKGGTSVASYGANARIGSESGMNAYVDSSEPSFSIRNGTTVLSRFTAEVIELGINALTTAISLCGGVGTIATDPITSALEITHGTRKGALISMFSDDTAANVGMYARYYKGPATTYPKTYSNIVAYADEDGSDVTMRTEKIVESESGGIVTTETHDEYGHLHPIGSASKSITTASKNGADVTFYLSDMGLSFDDTDYHVMITPEGQPNGFTQISYVVTNKTSTSFRVHSYNDYTASITQTIGVMVVHE